MGAEQSTPNNNQESVDVAPTSIAQTQRVNVRNFVINNINDAFNALQYEGFKNSNCYALLHTLTHGSITSDTIRDINLSILGVVFEGKTEFSVLFPQIYYRMFLSVSKKTNVAITSLLQKKQEWIRNPSQVVNDILGFSGARDKIGQSTNTQNNAISRACEKINQSAKSAGGGCSRSAIFKGASPEQQNRCCICGLGEPPQLTDIEHVVSSQLIILLGLCPGTKSWNGFWQVFNELNFSGGGGANWVDEVIKFFPKEQHDNARKVFRSMMLPAHETCNRSIKSEWSPFGIDLQNGTITGNINQPFADMNNKTYIEKVIEPSINDANNKKVRHKLKNVVLIQHKTEWIKNQTEVFEQIAWFLNSIDQRNNDASWFLIGYLYEVAKLNEVEQTSFVHLVADLLGLGKDDIGWETIDVVLNVEQNQLIIMTKLTLVVEAVLLLFQSDVQDPEQEVKDGDTSTDSSFVFADSSREDMATDTSLDTEPTAADVLSPGFSQVDNTQNSTATSGNPETGKRLYSYLLQSIDLPVNGTRLNNEINNEYDKQSTGSDADNENSNTYSQESTSSTISNQLGNNPGEHNKTDQSKDPREQRSDVRSKRQDQDENRQINSLIEEIAQDALDEYGKKHTLSNLDRKSLIGVARTSVYNVLNNRTINKNARVEAYQAAIDALNNNNDDWDNEMGGGSRNRMTRKYTTRGRRSTRKRRSSKKPRRTIRLQRRNSKRTQKRRK